MVADDLRPRAGDVRRARWSRRARSTRSADRPAPPLHLGAAALDRRGSTASRDRAAGARSRGSRPTRCAWPEGCRFRRPLPVRASIAARTMPGACCRSTDGAGSPRPLLGRRRSGEALHPPAPAPRPTAVGLGAGHDGDGPLLEVTRPRQALPGAARDLLATAVGECARSTASTLTIVAGETVGLVGESGCGKSTLGAHA